MNNSLRLTAVLITTMFFLATGTAFAQPKISNCNISPKEISYKTEVTISFDYEHVEGGLKEAKVVLSQVQKIQLPGEQREYKRTSNWQSFLTGLSDYASESGRFERKFVNPDLWPLEKTELGYEIKVVDKNGRESNACRTTIWAK